MARYLDREGALVLRRARKDHRCEVARKPAIHGPISCPLPDGIIKAGQAYIEYLGESSAYQSGIAYCVDCGQKLWAEWIVEPISR